MPSSLFAAVGHDGTRIVSPDGRTWRDLAKGKDGEVYRAVCFGNGRCVAAGTYGGKNIFAATADGKAWDTDSKDGKYKLYVRGMGFGKGMFVGIGGDPGSVGGSAPFVVTSDDGRKWSDYTEIAGKNIIRRIAWGNDTFVGVGDRGRRSASPDAKTWTDVPKAKAIDTMIDVAYGKPAGGQGLFVGVGLHGLRMSTRDGTNWSEKLMGEEGEHLNSIVWADDRFVAVGAGATYSSPDGVAWVRKPNKDAPTTLAYGNGVFIGSAWKGRILVSKDAVEWIEAHKTKGHIEGVGFGEMTANAVPATSPAVTEPGA
jgi:hypothetical protein